jgi:L-ascorbate metabolism protein UlaG (beta-lactamase superfamily)
LPRKPSGPGLSFALKLIAKSAFHPAAGEQHKPIIATPDQFGITFIGHASFLLQIGGLNFLIDPVFAHWLVLIHRMRRPGVRIQDLPPIDAVLLTHAHMDHLNFPSLRKVIRHTRKLTGKPPLVIVPKNVQDLIEKLGFSEVRALNWWQSTNIGGIEIVSTPAQHWGARVLSDTHRGFGGYNLQYGSQSIYHSGDTGYFSGFHEIRARLAPQVALLPIGAYKPDSFRGVHMSPEDAVLAFLDLGAQSLIPMHYGTFSLSEEPMDEPLQRLRQSAEQAGISKNLDILTEGETQILSENQTAALAGAEPQWYRSHS